ncbi:MAG: PIN domain-containing protein [Ignavibacteriae bacterium]|nr:PIN domain-containing protein [Ignavibacteriota bacterium]
MEAALDERVTRLFLDIVIGESLSVVARRCEEQRRTPDFAAIISSVQAAIPASRIQWTASLVRTLYNKILQMMVAYNGQLNFNDCLIALFMQRNNLQHLVSFDADFNLLSTIHRISSPEDLLHAGLPAPRP